MRKNNQLKVKAKLFFISAILLLCVGFIIASCGTSPQSKGSDPNAGAFALDFTSCPGTFCRLVLESHEFVINSNKQIAGKEITAEAWFQSKATGSSYFTGGILGRFDTAGIALFVHQGVPKAAVRRVNLDSSAVTGSSDYIVSSKITPIADFLWHHVAAVLSADDHSSTHTECTNVETDADCGGADTCFDKTHMDIYVDGSWKDCAPTYGNTNDDLVTAPAFAGEPGDPKMFVGVVAEGVTVGGVAFNTPFPGIIDEVRLWGVERSVSDILACKNQELGLNKGTCGLVTDGLIAYFRFNDGKGHEPAEWSGLGRGFLEYDDGPEFGHWSTGWTSDTPGF